MQVSNSGQDLSFLQCYTCFRNVKEPRMCPSCSKFACQNCLRTSIEESKLECPHCRQPLLLGSFADCELFVNDIKHLLSAMDNNQKLKEKCSEHRIEMSQYCEDCKDAMCPDCGMFGRHRGHSTTRLSHVYQQNKNMILNELAKLDNNIDLFRKNGLSIKQQMQSLLLQMGQKKDFIEQHFASLINKQKRDRVQAKDAENVQEIQFLDSFREDICRQLKCRTEKELISKSKEFISYIKSLCERERKIEEEGEYAFDTIHELVPKYHKFSYKLVSYSQQSDPFVYSEPSGVNGIEWRLKTYPKGNGAAKGTHLSVFLELSRGYENENRYDYKIELLNHLNPKKSIVREHSSKFDVGECWGYNQFLAIADLQNGFLGVGDTLHFSVSVRKPSYRSLVSDQQKFIEVLQNRLNCIENPAPQLRLENMNELAHESQQHKLSIYNLLRKEEEKEETVVREGEGELQM